MRATLRIAGALSFFGAMILPAGCSSKAGSDGIPLVEADTPADKLADAVRKSDGKARKDSEPRPLDELVRDCLPSVALVKGKVGHGAGFLLPNNIVATNAHVVALEFEENIRVHFPSAPRGKQGPFRAKFIFADRKRDLAFLEVPCDVEPLELAEDYTLRPGQEVIAIGSPGLGGNELLPNAPTRGLMSSMHKINGESFYAMSISVNPGNSGGPVIDMHGHVLGMVTLKARDKDGIAFAIPLSDLRNGYDQEVLGQGREAGPEMTAWIRACTVMERLFYLGEEYCFGLDTYSRAMDVATARGGTPGDGLRSVSKEMDGHLKQMNRIFADDLERNVRIVIQDENLRSTDRERIEALWNCCRAMKAMIDSPSGTLDAYRARKENLKFQYRELTTAKEKPKKPQKKAEKKDDDD